MHHNEASLIATLSYSDIFDYPLTKAEIWRYLISSKPIRFSTFSELVDSSVYIKQENGFYFLPRRNALMALRKKRKKISEEKLAKSKNILTIISKIPTIEMIGISGSLAMLNADKDADVDLFVITKANTLWMTRLLILLILQFTSTRRKRGDIKARDKICVNMLVDTEHLAFPKKRQDVYTAHEIVQMKIVVSKNNMHEKFLAANYWIHSLLPNSMSYQKIKNDNKKSFFAFFEFLAKTIQLLYIQKHKTTETIASGFVAFHPQDYKDDILLAFENKKKRYGI